MVVFCNWWIISKTHQELNKTINKKELFCNPILGRVFCCHYIKLLREGKDGETGKGSNGVAFLISSRREGIHKQQNMCATNSEQEKKK